ncbi:hypothetical protein MSG28_002996 [Choristoneura fumiferana]|uniref:Uncharacterized protein n=1 Tax=Choristoneura fumiferana TaxID=7141 RepID=A0ACC0JKE3_CHOFU|nr:hypothetical protein MSG28_002996 [Choristoneura fumiferana]
MSSEETKKSTESDLTSSGQSKHAESQKPADNCDKNKTNKSSGDSQGACYCGKDRNLNIVELLCASCSRWFHESCISYQLGKLVPFMTNYLFICKNCSPTGLETFKKNQALNVINNWSVSQESAKAGANKRLFSKDREIIPFIDQYWEAMTTMPRRVTQSWYATVQRALQKEVPALFTAGGAGGGGGAPGAAADGALYGLAESPAAIRPNYDHMIRQGQLKVTDMGVAAEVAKCRSGQMQKWSNAEVAKCRSGQMQKWPNAEVSPTVKRCRWRAAPRGARPSGAWRERARARARARGGRGRGGGGQAARGRRRGGGRAAGGARLPSEHPFNKDGYRYILAEPDPHAPFRQEFDESHEWSGKPIPGWLYRALCPGAVLLALHDRAPQLRVSEDRLACSGERGYCGVRASHGVRGGAWYWEAAVRDLGEGGAARIGWARRCANLQAPLGYDRFGYSWRSRKGTRFHESRGRHYGAPYGAGDVLGCLLTLPGGAGGRAPRAPRSCKDRPLVKFKSHLYYEDKDEAAAALAALRPLAGSRMVFFLNGASQGEAFADVYEGCYYPAVSLHRNITMSERAEEAICEQTLADMLYLAENEGKLRLDHYSL